MRGRREWPSNSNGVSEKFPRGARNLFARFDSRDRFAQNYSPVEIKKIKLIQNE